MHRRLSLSIPATLGLLASLALTAHAEVRLPALFSDHMVVQAGVAVPVWGWAAPNEEVTVALAGRSETTTTGPNGK